MSNVGPIRGVKASTNTDKSDLRELVRKLKTNIDEFNALIPAEEERLPDFAKATIILDQTSREALELTRKPTNCLMEDAQDSAETVQTVITQPLSVEGASENVSLISAAVSYSNENREETDLYKINQSFTRYPDQTESLKTELSLSSRDLDSY